MKLLTIKELSEFTKIKKSTLYAWAGKGLIPTHKLNGLLRFDLDEIEEWIKNSTVIPISVRNPEPKYIRNKDVDMIIKNTIESVKKQGYNSLKWENQTNQAQKKGDANGSL